MSPSKKRVLIAPLDWGLGHATRCIPVISEFLKQGCEVQIASSGDALALLRDEFSTLKFHQIASYNVSYSSTIPFMLKMLFQMPKFLMAIRKEHSEIGKIVKAEKIDLVISDNRYGCWSASVKSVLITHQINILMTGYWQWLQHIINYGNHRQIKKFSECWVPDFPGGITGKMTSPGLSNMKFIGMFSRFVKMELRIKYDVLGLISGPEPQRTIFENLLRAQLSVSGLRWFIVKGKPQSTEIVGSSEADHINAQDLNMLIESSDLIISRSGYTTVMDLWKLKKKSIFIPTPGQTEQKYLVQELERNGVVFCVGQTGFNLTEALKELDKYKGFEDHDSSSNLLSEAVENLLCNS